LRSAPTNATAITHFSEERLCQACRVPFWTTQSPALRRTSTPSSNSRCTSPQTTTSKSTVSVVCWNDPLVWQRHAEREGLCYRFFTCSLSDFFHVKADPWRDEAWDIIRSTPNLVWLILTKRPEVVQRRLPSDWPDAFPNVWLGVSSGCRMTLNKMDSLRRIPVHPKAVRLLSAEPLLEDIADFVNLSGFGWVIVGGESGPEWAEALLHRARATNIPFFFKQITAFRSGQGEDALRGQGG